MSEPKLNIKEETSAKKTRSPPKKAKVEQTVPKKKKLKTDADKVAEKAQRRRPQVARRHPMAHLLPGRAWNRRCRKAKPLSAPL